MTVEGLEVIALESQLGPLPTGVPLVLFLAYDASTDRYRILDGAGAFVLKNGAYEPMLKMSFDPPVERSRFVQDLDGEAHATSVP
jgi:hypothetical protein